MDSAESSSSARTSCGGGVAAGPPGCPGLVLGEATGSPTRGEEPLRIELSARHARERADGVSAAAGAAGSTGASDIPMHSGWGD